MATREQELIRRRIDATDDDIALFVSRLDKFWSANLRRILAALKTGAQNAVQAASILGSLQTALEAAGLTDELRALRKIYGKQLDNIAETFAEVKSGDIFSRADRTTVETLVNFDESVITNKIYQATDSLSSTLIRQVVTGAKLDTNQLIEDFGATTAQQITTEMNTATSGFYRSMTQAKAKELDVEYFAYVGPLDDITRPFCKSRVNKIFTRSQIQKWDNGTNLPADIYGGGYNCRHDLVPMSKERAEQRVKEGVYQWA